MKNRIIYFLLLCCLSFAVSAQNNITLVSWNLENLGRSKNDAEINFIATIVKDFDIIAVQEVVAGVGGAQSVARLGDALNRKGSQWDYRISDPTSGINSYKRERYAFLWKTSRVQMSGRPWLEKKYSLEINREPYFATFKAHGETFTIVNFHAITKSMQPETEIKFFKFLPAEYPDLNLIFCGDFNVPQSHTVFNPLKKMGFLPSFIGQKTTLKMTCINNQCLASEFDNIFYHRSKVHLQKSGVVHFYQQFATVKEARVISDHIPVWIQFFIK